MALGSRRRADSASSAATTLCPVKGDIGLHQHTLATPLIDDGQDPKGPAGHELVVHEIHAPRLIATTGRRHHPTMQTEPLLTTGAHPHLQALQAIQAVNPLLVISPPFASQHDP